MPRKRSPISIDFQAAEEQRSRRRYGEKYEGPVHKKCGYSLRYVSSGSCVYCASGNSEATKLKARATRWRRALPTYGESY